MWGPMGWDGPAKLPAPGAAACRICCDTQPAGALGEGHTRHLPFGSQALGQQLNLYQEAPSTPWLGVRCLPVVGAHRVVLVLSDA